MSRLAKLFGGFPGHPSHPPLTDAVIGAYTVGVLMLVLGALGVEEEAMAHGALLAISGGLILTPPTAITGLLDWLQLPKGSPVRRTGLLHLLVMDTAAAAFIVTWLLQRPGYLDGSIRTGGLVAGIVAELILTVGGYLGGTIVFVYGHRVLEREDVPVREALGPVDPNGDRQPAIVGRSQD